MTDDEKKLKALRDEMPPPIAAHTNGMVIAVYKGPHPSTQFPSEAAARFYLEAYRLVPSLFARIEELEKCSDPALVDRLVQDVAAHRLENEKLAARVKLLEDQVAIEVNLRTKAQVRVRNGFKVLSKLAEAAKRAGALEAELTKARETPDWVELRKLRKENEAAAKAIAALEDIGEQAKTYIDTLADALRKAVDKGLRLSKDGELDSQLLALLQVIR